MTTCRTCGCTECELAAARRQIDGLSSERSLLDQEVDGLLEQSEALSVENTELFVELARLKTDHELALTALATARNDLLRSLPREQDKVVIRWIRDALRVTDTCHSSPHYTAALELLQRLQTVRVGDAS